MQSRACLRISPWLPAVVPFAMPSGGARSVKQPPQPWPTLQLCSATASGWASPAGSTAGWVPAKSTGTGVRSCRALPIASLYLGESSGDRVQSQWEPFPFLPSEQLCCGCVQTAHIFLDRHPGCLMSSLTGSWGMNGAYGLRTLYCLCGPCGVTNGGARGEARCCQDRCGSY